MKAWWMVVMLLLISSLACARPACARHGRTTMVGESRIPNERGVFALVDFKKGDVVERSPVVRVQYKPISNTSLNDHVFSIDDDEKEAGIALGYGSLINHSDTPNVSFRYDPQSNEMVFKATRAIRAGEELFSSYGKDWWEDRQLKPL